MYNEYGDFMDTWNRLELLTGKELFNQYQKTTVLVIGLGGVGGYAVETLARSGIGKLILVDYDTIEESNINRQLIALHSTVGMKKCQAWQNRIQQINLSCEVIIKDMFLTATNIEELFQEKIDYVIDACDTVATKKVLIQYCVQHHIQMISSMGMGNKLDPTKVSVMDLRKTNYDPIAKILRKMIKEENIKEKIMVVSSTEAPIIKQKIIASNAFVPAVAGLLCANYIIKLVGEK